MLGSPPTAMPAVLAESAGGKSVNALRNASFIHQGKRVHSTALCVVKAMEKHASHEKFLSSQITKT